MTCKHSWTHTEYYTYKLYGLICDYRRHFIAYTWDTNNWTEYNDLITRNASLQSIDMSHAYLAFYVISHK
ncbi:unnamed protein product [Blepharisma stoltei]|uniref:USP domain-containing protein n=1 Tax=Blepharisma stoltei TaxID=1481888 RepID=A0AAU9KH67_9CILI|nr:unnamed protein product [Blepharisma stoltei]